MLLPVVLMTACIVASVFAARRRSLLVGGALVLFLAGGDIVITEPNRAAVASTACPTPTPVDRADEVD